MTFTGKASAVRPSAVALKYALKDVPQTNLYMHLRRLALVDLTRVYGVPHGMVTIALAAIHFRGTDGVPMRGSNVANTFWETVPLKSCTFAI